MLARQGDQWMEKLRGEAVILDLKAPGKGEAPAK